MKAIWKLTWHMNCLNKIKHFFWRACKNGLPTKLKLKDKGIGSDDRCEFCDQSESSGHALWSCKTAEEVLSNTKLKLPFFQDPPRDFIDIVWVIYDTHPGINWELFAVIFWSLWNNRNKVCHGEQGKRHEIIVREAAAYLKEVQEVKQPIERPSIPAKPPWIPPNRGCFKVNTDEAIFEELGCCGIGVVIRNERGQLIGAMSKKIELPLDVLEAEAKALEEGMLLAWDLGLKEITLESDSELVAKALSDQRLLQISIQKVIEGIKEGLNCFLAATVTHTYKSGNSPAHILARHAKLLNHSIIWVEDTPPIIADHIQNDVTGLNSISFNEI